MDGLCLEDLSICSFPHRLDEDVLFRELFLGNSDELLL